MSRSLGQVAYEAYRDAGRNRELYKPGVVFTLAGAKEYPLAEEWQELTREVRSDWEHTAIEVLMEYKSAPAA